MLRCSPGFIILVKKLPELMELFRVRQRGALNNKYICCLRAKGRPQASQKLSHWSPALLPWGSEASSAEWPGDLFLSVAMKSVIRCLETWKMKKLHRHRVGSISKWAVTNIRKRINETDDAATKQERKGEGQESRMRFGYKSHLQTHIQKKWEQDRQKKTGKSRGKKGKIQSKT